MATRPISDLIATPAEALAGLSHTTLITPYLLRRTIFSLFPERFDIYVDSENGSDSNDGLTPETALATPGAIEWRDNIRVGFARGSFFREGINGVGGASDVWLDAYGTGPMPVFACDDVIEGTWTQPDPETYPNVWMQTLTHTVLAPNQYLSMWADDARMFWVEDLDALNDPPEVDQAGGYYHVATTVDATASESTTADFYIYSEADPNNDGVTYEYSSRPAGIRTGERWLVRNVRTRRNGSNDGSLILETNSEAELCLVEDGTKHNAFAAIGCAFRSCIAWKCDWPVRDGWSAFVGYVWDGRGYSVAFEGNVVVVEDHIFDWSLDNNRLPVGILAHNNSDEEGWDEVIIRDNAVYGAITGIEVNNAKVFTEARNYVGGCRFGVVSNADVWNSLDPYVEELEGRAVIRALSRNGRGVVSIEGARVFLRRGHQSGGAVYMPGDEPWSLTKSIIYRDGTGADGFGLLVGSGEDPASKGTVTQNIIRGSGGTGNGTLIYGADSVVENNVYYPFAMQFQGSAEFYPDWVTYEAGETVRDRNSVLEEPLVNDPANGDWTLDGSSPAIALGAGLERPNVAYTPIPTAEELEAL